MEEVVQWAQVPGWLAGQLLPLSNQTVPISMTQGLERAAELGVEKQLKS